MKNKQLVILIAVGIIFLLPITTLLAQEKMQVEKHKESIVEIFFGPGDNEFVCYNKVHRNFYTGIFILAISLGVVLYGRYRIKNVMATKLQQKNIIIEEKNRDITDSITYAKRLQEAMLPSINRIRECFPESFVLYKPKDIVAGDFYWLEILDDWIFIAVADCTGHGVPGAMVSVVCSNALNRAVKEFGIYDTGKILDKTRELIIETFAQSTSEVLDGMDISLLGINRTKSKILWSGANNPLWFLESKEMRTIKADKQPIGKTDNPKSFATHSISCGPGTIFYLLTDGYADQFGGAGGKKYKYQQLKNTLVENSGMALEDQYKMLSKYFDNWKGNLEQIDDVTIIGIKL